MLLYKGHECQGWNKDKHKLPLLQCHQLITQRLSFPIVVCMLLYKGQFYVLYIRLTLIV